MENLTYLDYLNTDLFSVLLSTLNHSDLENFIEVYDDHINWKDAFLFRFPDKLFNNFKEYDPKKLYLGFTYFLNLENVTVVHKYNVLEYGEDKTHDIDFIRYIVTNDLIKIDEQFIGELGDIFIYEKYKDKYDILMIASYAMTINNLGLVGHIFNDPLFIDKIKEDDNINDVLVDDFSNSEMTVEMTKLILKYYPNLMNMIFENTINKDIFKYILDNYMVPFTSVHNVLFKHDHSDHADVFVKMLVDKYYDQIKGELPELYLYIANKDIEKTDFHKILVYLARFDVIKKEFEIEL